MKKICIVTGTRSEYGLLKTLIKEIKKDSELKLQVIATGMHLSYEFGLTYKTIESDGFKIDKKVEMLLSSDSRVAISKSMGVAQIGFADAYEELKPDLVVVLGDRFEIYSATTSAMIARIPIAHIHGGETTEGVIDEAIRHSITKMSHLHFCATNEYRDRIIQLGENPKRVFNVGGLGIDSIKNSKLLNKNEFEKAIKFKLNQKNIFIIFHPTTLEEATSEGDEENLIFIFPAGLVSRKIDGKIQDLEWKNTFLTRSIRNKRDIIPVFIDGKNSKRFYSIAYWRKMFGIKANLEMFFLIDEMFEIF